MIKLDLATLRINAEFDYVSVLNNAKLTICIENNATGQLAKLISLFGFKVDKKILKYDGRPFVPEEISKGIK